MSDDQVAKRARMEGESVNEEQRKSTPPKEICNLTTQKFSRIVDFESFVDKTLFIKAFLKTHDVIVATAPRRFGKSTLLDMIKEFVTGNKKLFEDNELKIWKEERFFFDENCQENPVIYVDFKTITGTTINDILSSLKSLVSEAFNAHRYLIKEVDGKYSWSDPKLRKVGNIAKFEQYWKNPKNLTRDDVIIGLKRLSHCLHVYYNKPVYVFIDEYDFPVMQMIMKTYVGKKDLNETIDLIGELMSGLFKNNQYLKKGLIMACVRIAQVLSGYANNIQYYEFLKEEYFSPYFGFTDKEVDSLFEKEEFAPFKDNRVKEWYNGYKLMHTEDYVIYSCSSVLKYLDTSKEMKEPHFENYWVDSGCITDLEELFAETQIRRLIEELIDGEEVVMMTIEKFSKKDIFSLQQLVHQKLEIIDFSQAHLFLLFLTDNGYLNVVSTGNGPSTIRAPNNEIKELLRGKCYNATLFVEKYHLSRENISSYLNALESLLKQKRDKKAFIRFAKAISKLFEGAIMPKSEDEFHSILFTLAYNYKTFMVCSELSVQRQKRRGRPRHLDLLVILDEVGMILEVKFDVESSAETHSQIVTQQYETAFDNYKNAKEKILMGVHMTKERKVSLTYTINDSSIETVTSDDVDY